MIEINDHGSLRRVGSRLHTQGRALPDEVTDAVERHAEKVKDEIVRSAASILPKRGGLAGIVSHMDITLVRQANAVSIVAKSRYNLESLDRGSVRHPVYGRRDSSVTQSIKGGFWSDPTKDSEPAFEAAVEKSLDRITNKIEG